MFKIERADGHGGWHEIFRGNSYPDYWAKLSQFRQEMSESVYRLTENNSVYIMEPLA